MRRIKNNKWRRLGTLILITAGIVLLYPMLTDFYAWYEQGIIKEQVVQGPVNQNLNNIAESTAPGDENSSPGSSVPIIPWGLLEIPDLGLSLPVIAGTEPEQLNLAPGWYTNSALPGHGNTAIAGHRTMYGGPFRNLHLLQPGNEITLLVKDEFYKYRVEEVTTVESNDWSMILPCGYNALTLTTCTPEGQDKRCAVRARME